MRFSRLTLCIAAALAVTACNSQQPPEAEQPEAPAAKAAPDSAPTQTVSILRPEIETLGSEGETPIGPLAVTIGFPDGGNVLDADAVAALETVLKSEQLALGQTITLASHSDSAGTDAANIRASEKRGLAVAQWLIDQGVDADRITVIAFGEQNPLAPNALPDGSANETGRAANRRVEILVQGEAGLIPEEGGAKSMEDEASEDGSIKTRD